MVNDTNMCQETSAKKEKRSWFPCRIELFTRCGWSFHAHKNSSFTLESNSFVNSIAITSANDWARGGLALKTGDEYVIWASLKMMMGIPQYVVVRGRCAKGNKMSNNGPIRFLKNIVSISFHDWKYLSESISCYFLVCFNCFHWVMNRRENISLCLYTDEV